MSVTRALCNGCARGARVWQQGGFVDSRCTTGLVARRVELLVLADGQVDESGCLQTLLSRRRHLWLLLYGSVSGLHAFIDESCRRDRYLLTAVLVAPLHLQQVTQGVRKAVPKGQRRSHFSDERPAARKQILDGFCRLAVAGDVAGAEYPGGDDQAARESCLSMLAQIFTRRGVQVMVLDSRGVDRDQADRRHLAYLQRLQILDPAVSYGHRGSRDEVLLSLPDAIGWAYGAGGAWRRQVEPLIEVHLAVKSP